MTVKLYTSDCLLLNTAEAWGRRCSCRTLLIVAGTGGDRSCALAPLAISVDSFPNSGFSWRQGQIAVCHVPGFRLGRYLGPGELTPRAHHYLAPLTFWLSPDEDPRKPQCRMGRKGQRLCGHAEMCWPHCAWRQWRRSRELRCQLVRQRSVAMHDHVLIPPIYRDHVVDSRLPRPR